MSYSPPLFRAPVWLSCFLIDPYVVPTDAMLREKAMSSQLADASADDPPTSISLLLAATLSSARFFNGA